MEIWCGYFDLSKIVSEYDQEIPQSQTADNLRHREEEPLNHHETPGRQIKQSNQLSRDISCLLRQTQSSGTKTQLKLDIQACDPVACPIHCIKS